MTRAVVGFACGCDWGECENPRHCRTGKPYLRLAHPSGITWARRSPRPERLLVDVGPVVRAREPEPGDPVPRAALAMIELARAGGHEPEAFYACGVVDPEALRECSVCHAECLVNDDGELRVHGPKDSRCPGSPTGPGIPAVVHSVLVRGEEHWAALWENGKAAGRWWQREPCSDAELRAHLAGDLPRPDRS